MFIKNLWFLKPIQFATQGQWWSILSTQTPHCRQWCVLSGLNFKQWGQKRLLALFNALTTASWWTFCATKSSFSGSVCCVSSFDCDLGEFFGNSPASNFPVGSPLIVPRGKIGSLYCFFSSTTSFWDSLSSLFDSIVPRWLPFVIFVKYDLAECSCKYYQTKHRTWNWH